MMRIALILGLLILSVLPAAAENRLAEAASPYLRQHAKDPVHWRQWTPEVIAAAKAAGRPILLSIGYSACHWCHVMQRESFEDPAIAEVINTRFTPILIDREERPDLDGLFQTAALVMQVPGGWPLTMFLTADGKPFYGGTYFPPKPRAGMPSFRNVLDTVTEVHATQTAALAEDAARITGVLERLAQARPGEVTLDHADSLATFILSDHDPLAGGFGEESKFPHLTAHELLWRGYIRNDDKVYREAVELSLRAMLQGGMYDHVGGGFFRYTVDPLWRTPHYEKMLDVNAGMLRLMTAVWRETGDAFLETRIRETVAFLLRDMRLAQGGLAASLDADSANDDGEKEEGAFYVWSRAQITGVLGEAAPAFLAAYDLAPPEHGSIDGDTDPGTLFLERGDTQASELARLRQVRAGRKPPFRDDKVLADWTGFAVAALADAGAALGEPGWIVAAAEVFNAADRALSGAGGRLHHSAHDGQQGAPATLGGLAAMIHAALTLHEVSGGDRYLARARAWAGMAETHHKAPGENGAHGGYYDSADDAGFTPVRDRPFSDTANAAPMGEMVRALARLYFLTGETVWRDRADGALRAVGGRVAVPSFGAAGMINAAETLIAALQVVVIGARGEARTQALLAAVNGTSTPARVLQVISPGTELRPGHPARYKEQVDGTATAYVCRGTFCSLPAVEAGDLRATLRQMRVRPELSGG